MLGDRGRVQGTSKIGRRMYAEITGTTSKKLRQEAIRSDIRAGRFGSRKLDEVSEMGTGEGSSPPAGWSCLLSVHVSSAGVHAGVTSRMEMP